MLQGVTNHILTINYAQRRFLQKNPKFSVSKSHFGGKNPVFGYFWIIFRTSFSPANIEGSAQNVQNFSNVLNIFFEIYALFISDKESIFAIRFVPGFFKNNFYNEGVETR